jgi:uncharacterized protein YjbI with pentapeptide repeats
MAHSFDTFKVELIDRVYLRNDGFTTPRTARIQLFDARGKVIVEYALAAPIIPEIYEAIGRGEAVNLDECYLHGFSLTACRRFLILDKNTPVKIKGFSARNTVFETAYNIDLSYGEFETETFSVDGSIFIGKEVSFHASEFRTNGVAFSNCFIKTDRFDMGKTVFHDGEVSFKNTIFDKGVKDFQDASFGNGDVSFVNTEFGDGDVSFINARFNDGDCSFKVARFGNGKVDFHYAKFGKGSISFEQTEFGSGRADFRTVEFGTGRTSFNRCAFGDGEVTFEGAEATGKVSLKRVTFGNTFVNFDLYQGKDSELIFERSTFLADVSFKGAILKGLHLDECQFNSTFNLHVDTCDNLDLTGCTFRDIVEFYTHGEPPKVKVLNLTGMRLLGILYLDWEINKIEKLIYNQTETSLREKAEQFRILKQNFNNSGQYDDEDKAYIEFKRNESLAILTESISKDKISAIWQYPSYGFKKLVFDWMGLYATSPLRVVLSNIVMILFFAFLYTIIPYFTSASLTTINPDDPFWTKYWTAAYYTGITYFTVGYGEIVPLGILRLVADITAFIGVFMMSYFTVAFVRKILR